LIVVAGVVCIASVVVVAAATGIPAEHVVPRTSRVVAVRGGDATGSHKTAGPRTWPWDRSSGHVTAMSGGSIAQRTVQRRRTHLPIVHRRLRRLLLLLWAAGIARISRPRSGRRPQRAANGIAHRRAHGQRVHRRVLARTAHRRALHGSRIRSIRTSTHGRQTAHAHVMG